MNVERVRKLLEYKPETGELFWRESRGRVKKGARAGSPVARADGKTYWYIRVDDRKYLVHRIIWYITFGYWPTEIDHINGDEQDNRLSNLRDVSHSINQQNIISRKKLSKLPMGVKATPAKKYQARIWIGGKHLYLGTFDSIDQASGAYKRAKKRYHRGYVGTA